MMRVLLAVFFLATLAVPAALAAPLQPYSGPQDVSQLFSYLNTLINQINANALLTSSTPGGSSNTIPATNANGSIALGGSTAQNSSLLVQTVVNAVDMLQISGSTTGNPILLTAAGTDRNINISLVPAGAGVVQLGNPTNFVRSAGLTACPAYQGGQPNPIGMSPTVTGYFVLADFYGLPHYVPVC